MEHAEKTRTPDRPFVLSQKTYPKVKSGHIVPKLYQDSFAVNGQVAVHIDGGADCVLMSTKDAGTRSAYYARERRDGKRIDDVEVSLSRVEDMSAAPLRDLIAREPITAERKAQVATFLGLQMVRGPAFFEQREETSRPLLESMEASDLKPAALARSGGDVEEARSQAIATHLSSTERFVGMLRYAPKMAGLLSLMRWQILRFADPLLAYSDHPVVVWPVDRELSEPFGRQGLAPLSAREIRVPLSPEACLLMNWIDLSDESDHAAEAGLAAEVNAFTVGQADRQWMHRPGEEPPLQSGALAPISPRLETRYDRSAVVASQRRALAWSFNQRSAKRSWVKEIEVLVEMEPTGGIG